MDETEVSLTPKGRGFIASAIVGGEKIWAYGDTQIKALGELVMTEGFGIRVKDFSDNIVEPQWHKQATASARSAAVHRQKR